MKNTLLFFLILILVFPKSVNAQNKALPNFVGCKTEVSKENQNLNSIKIKKIEVDIYNYRNWVVNGIRILTSQTRFVGERYKKRFKSIVTVTYNNNSKCFFPARVRHSGDEKDHIALFENSIIQSLDVHLDYGNIKGITKFKLLKPDTRGVLEDVLIQTQLLRNLGYLAPRTYKINSRINKTNSVMLFQEKASKELLEFNNRREGPILESDEKYFYKIVEDIPDNNKSNWSHNTPYLRTSSSKAMLTKSTNPNLVYRGEKHKEISLNAVSDLNLIYLYWSNRFQDEKNNYFYFDYDLDNTLLALFNKENTLKLDIYNLLMLSTNSHHALSVNNRKFYWNSIENYFEPINYDANPAIDRKTPTTTTLNYMFPVSIFINDAFTLLDEKLNKTDLDHLYNQLLISGSNLTKKELEQKVEKIIINLKEIKNNYQSNTDEDKIKYNFFKPIDNILETFNKTVNEIDPNAYLIKYNKDNNFFEKCEDLFLECINTNFDNENLSSLLEGELEVENTNYQFVGTNFDIENEFKNRGENFSLKSVGNSSVYFEKGIKVDVDTTNKKINIEQKVPGARAFLMGGFLRNYQINFKGYNIINWEDGISLKQFPKNYPINEKNLTGCLSLINIELKDVSIFANNSSCEDTVNFINARGNVNNVVIENSFSDALDIDFSKMNFGNIKINNALNDCVDFSAGDYSLDNLILTNCGDKGLSIGERSQITLNEIKVDKANIGIATKDSSYLKLKNAKINNIKTCVSAYNKKQEYDGGIIEMNTLDCEKYLRIADLDNSSKIYLNNELLKNYLYGDYYDPFELKVDQINGNDIIGHLIKDYKALNDDGTVNVVVEIPVGLKEKWEVTKLSGSLWREFYMGTPRSIDYEPYPINYGMIPQTILPVSRGGDGDPLDVVILGKKLTQGSVVKVKPLGIMKMMDGGEKDDKIIAVPLDSSLNIYNNIKHLNNEKPEILIKVKSWFLNYKGNNVVKFIDYESDEQAKQLIELTVDYFDRFGLKERS